MFLWGGVNSKLRLLFLKPLTSYWSNSIRFNLYYWNLYYNRNKKYGEAGFTRIGTKEHICHCKEIWKNRNIIIIEGEKTRLGVGNDLIDNAKSIHRILAPAESAYEDYAEILKTAEYVGSKEIDPLFLIALGPTAKLLVYDLSLKGYQSIDIGHLDIVYEWRLHGCLGKMKIPGKYVNEVSGGNIVEECCDVNYLNSIIYRTKHTSHANNQY